MKRRKFILSTVFSIFTYKAFIHKFSRSKIIDDKNILISNSLQTYITLKSGMSYQLPDSPQSVKSVIHFKVVKTKSSPSPIIISKKDLIDEKNGQFIVEESLNLNNSRFFTLQYINEKIGWKLFVS